MTVVVLLAARTTPGGAVPSASALVFADYTGQHAALVVKGETGAEALLFFLLRRRWWCHLLV